jgi:hypothetical protein
MKNQWINLFQSLLTFAIVWSYLLVIIACCTIKLAAWTALTLLFNLGLKIRWLDGDDEPYSWSDILDRWREEWDHDVGRHL